jgi:hypothetical protein
MSVVFSNYSTGSASKSGYFRIGNVVLNIPPTNIITDRIINNNRKAILRGKNELFTKSGQARWDVTISWTAVQDPSTTNPNSEWSKLQTILAMFKVAPFVEVENAHIRQIFTSSSLTSNGQRMAFGMRQLKVDSHPDIVDGLIVTLTMTYFNYAPYTLDFGYVGDSQQPTDATKSGLFADYLTEWKSNNLTVKDPAFQPAPWNTQTPGTLTFAWREYKTLNVIPPLVTPDALATTNPPTPAPTAAKGLATLGNASGLTGANLAFVNTLNSAAASAAKSWLSAVVAAGYSFTITSALRTYQQQSALYATYVSQGGQSKVGTPGGPKYLVASPGTLNADGSVTGGSSHESGLCLDIVFTNHPPTTTPLSNTSQPAIAAEGHHAALNPLHGNNAFQYALQIAGSYGWTHPFPIKDSVHWLYKGGVTNSAGSATTILPVPPRSTALNTNTNPTGLGPLSVDKAEMQALIDQGFKFEYLTETKAFFYKLHEIKVNQAVNLVTSQVSVLFVNNLAQIPLANYQYPTYQHIGPASSLVSIQMTSTGSVVGNNDPIHSGLASITGMSAKLEEQYMAMQAISRTVKSIHAMQAVFVQNPVLNLLGIFSLLPEQISTEIVQESANMVQINFTSHQYENMYEDIEPYKINGITGSYITAVRKIIQSGSLTNLTSAEQSLLTKVLQFESDYKSSDANALGGWILDAATSASNGDFISTLTANPVITLDPSQIQALTNNLQGSGNKYPSLISRANAAKSAGYLTYADYVAFKSYNTSTTGKISSALGFMVGATPDTGQLATIDSAVNSQINNIPSVTQGLYTQLIVFISNSDSVFAAQLQQLISSPQYSAQMSAAVPQSPSGQNPGHGAYKDLGLPDTIDGLETNPGMFFFDYNQKYRSLVQSNLPGLLASISGSTNQANDTSASVTNTPAVATGAIPTDPNQLAKMINIPGYSMAEAFPTFKLFFMEDANNGIFYAFDQFYSYSSIIEMEIVRAYDKPATAIVRMTNLYHIFDHKLFDNSLVGKREKDLAMQFNFSENATSGPTTNSNGSSTSVSLNPITNQIVGEDHREGFDPANPKLVPLKYFPLQTGSKVQIRFGYSNDPDKLTPVFNGQVTQIEEGELGELIITCQSWLLELMTTPLPADSATNSSWFAINAILGGGAAFSGTSIFSDKGDAQSVIRTMLSNPAAKHFGHFMLNGAAPDNLLKGFNTWQTLSGSVASAIGNTSAAALINNAYDRSGENIMVNNYVDFTGNSQAGRTRSYFDQGDTSLFSLFDPYTYYVDSNLNWTLWQLIRDVSRRYPEYLLLEKFYGFPYEADSTLVFSSPLDWYFARPTLIGDDEAITAAETSTSYADWWRTQGAERLTRIVNQFKSLLDPIISFLSGNGVSSQNYVNQASTSFAALQAADKQLIIVATNSSIIPNFKERTDELKNFTNALAHLEAAYQAYVSVAADTNGQPNNSRIKPTRRYHFVDHQTIVHNGIKLNDKVYNAIKISAEKKSSYIQKANTNIPSQHLRVLDVSDQINDPDKNVLSKSGNFATLICQSFLKEELGKMYRGELVLRGIPEIEPMDIILLLDPSTGVVGPVEVDQVINSFTQEMGYVTIIKPRAFIAINETAGASIGRGLAMTMASSVNTLLGRNVNSKVTVQDALNGGALDPAAVPTVISPLNPLLGLVDLLAASAFFTIVDDKFVPNPVLVQPLSRFNRPWVGGLQGFTLTGLRGHFDEAFLNWKADNIWPLIDLYRKANNLNE